MSRGPAIWATAIAIALANIGLAALIVAAIGKPSFAPVWIGGVLLVLGLAAAAAALVLWRRFLADLRAR